MNRQLVTSTAATGRRGVAGLRLRGIAQPQHELGNGESLRQRGKQLGQLLTKPGHLGRSDPKVTARVLERLRTGPKQDPRLASLTDQEHRILDLIAEGLTNRQIGNRLGLAEKTVKNYVSSLLAKIGMRSRTQAALYVASNRAAS